MKQSELLELIRRIEAMSSEAGYLLMALSQSHQSPEMFEMALRCSRLIRSSGELQFELQRYLDAESHRVDDSIADKLAELDQLKKHQDADYFLSAQLLKPFAIDMLVCDNVEAQTLTQQKRKFRFGNKSGSIGGDISFIYPMTLENRSYTLIANADAMGKSIQGAGGALVFAAVLKGITSRTAISEHAAAQAPESWLREALMELQKVFLSFEGTMLVTAFLGLLDNTTGVLYYVNAEHPKPVLIRSGEVSFLESRNTYYRIGLNPELWSGRGATRQELQISSVRLRFGDAIICATDGRDDVALGGSAGGDRVINDDDTMFARIVEQADGDLGRIFETLTQRGELIDDISFLKIQYYGESAQSLTPADITAQIRRAMTARDRDQLELLIRRHEAILIEDTRFDALRAFLAYRRHAWDEALLITEAALRKNPVRFSCLRLRLACFLQLKEYAEAAQVARKLRLLDADSPRSASILKKSAAILV